SRERAAGERSFITDRGTLDAMAFHHQTMHAVGTSEEKEYRRYSAVIQLGTTAALGPMYYRTDAVRTEPIEEALQIEAALRRVWSGHPRYHFVPAAEEIEQKFTRFVTIVNDLMHNHIAVNVSPMPSSLRKDL
ncbi:MAG: hypothetical protein D6800_03320, partial [Candidatus Zixiibacteriota bacterium]